MVGSGSDHWSGPVSLVLLRGYVCIYRYRNKLAISVSCDSSIVRYLKINLSQILSLKEYR